MPNGAIGKSSALRRQSGAEKRAGDRGGAYPDISRVEVTAAARRRAMKLYLWYSEWPATQRMRPDRLARRVKIFQDRSSFSKEKFR